MSSEYFARSFFMKYNSAVLDIKNKINLNIQYSDPSRRFEVNEFTVTNPLQKVFFIYDTNIFLMKSVTFPYVQTKYIFLIGLSTVRILLWKYGIENQKDREACKISFEQCFWWTVYLRVWFGRWTMQLPSICINQGWWILLWLCTCSWPRNESTFPQASHRYAYYDNSANACYTYVMSVMYSRIMHACIFNYGDHSKYS